MTKREPACLDGAFALEQYEALRQEAIEGAIWKKRGHGLHLFMSRGMAAWLHALKALAPRPEKYPSTAQAPSLAQGPLLTSCARSELAHMVAGMIFSCHQEAVSL